MYCAYRLEGKTNLFELPTHLPVGPRTYRARNGRALHPYRGTALVGVDVKKIGTDTKFSFRKTLVQIPNTHLVFIKPDLVREYEF